MPISRFVSVFVWHAALYLAASTAAAAGAIDFTRQDDRVEALLAQMTLEEKIGQLRQLRYLDHHSTELGNRVAAGGAGSALNIFEPDEIRQLQRRAVEDSRLGIPLIIGRDVIHGFRTIFPIPLGLSATWNPDLIRRSAQIAAAEARQTGIHWTFAPMIDVTRDPRWGRVAESPGEDPFLASVFARAMIAGFQGNDLSAPDSLAATAKHFAGYGKAEGGRDYNTTWIPDQQLWEVYLPPFEAAVDAGVATLMTAFNDLNGIPATGNRFLLKDVLRERWGFDGFVVSDWDSVVEMISHGFAANKRQAGTKALLAGLDMEMKSDALAHAIPRMIEEGIWTEADLDQRVRHILRVKFALGLFENPYPAEGAAYPPPLDPRGAEVATRAAIESFVLLKNEGDVLPLDPNASIALIGPLADAPRDQLGTWAFDGQSMDTITPREAFQRLAESEGLQFHYAAGLAYSRDQSRDGFAQALAAAKEADVIVFVGGEEAILSGEAHSRAVLDLPGAQAELINELAKLDKPLILVVMAGRPLTLEPILEDVDAFLYAWHPGTMGGLALAKVLRGGAEPSGRLTITFPRTVGQIPIYYGHRNTGRPFVAEEFVPIDEIPLATTQSSVGHRSYYLDYGHHPQYPFGYGLGYTTFDYSEVRLSRPEATVGDAVEASVTVTNTGERAGSEVVQLYIHDPVAGITRPVKELKGFEKLTLAPGESREVRFEVTPTMLSFPDPDGHRHLEPGMFRIFIGPNSETVNGKELRLEAKEGPR